MEGFFLDCHILVGNGMVKAFPRYSIHPFASYAAIPMLSNALWARFGTVTGGESLSANFQSSLEEGKISREIAAPVQTSVDFTEFFSDKVVYRL